MPLDPRGITGYAVCVTAASTTSAAADPLVGTTIGNVRLTARLGAGAMGVVYRGWHERLAREVAVKMLSQENQKTSSRERFLREGRAAAKVQHDHVVQVLEAGESGPTAYLVMELVIGHSLGEILDEVKARDGKGALPADVAARLGVGMALGIAAIHAKGIVHRDVKPDNVLVSSEKKAKIADLGLAKQLDEPELQRLTGSGMVVGTPLYVSPEAIREPSSIRPPADVYGLGATLYHALTGRPPFEGKTAYDVMRGHLEERPKAILELSPKVPAGLAQLVERCLHKDPAKRPTALELADLLGQGANLRAKANLGFLVVIAVATIAVVGAGFGAWWALQPGPPPPPPPAEARVHIAIDHPHVSVQVDGAAPVPLTRAGLLLTPGPHQLLVAADQPGARWSWQGAVEAVNGKTTTVDADLTTTALAEEVRVPIPGGGLLVRDGRPIGTDAAITCKEVGVFHVARWSLTAGSRSWAALTLRIGVDGKVAIEERPVATIPAGDAFWRTVDNDGAPVPAHHHVCWLVAEEARKVGNLPATAAWSRLRDRPEEPARELTAGWAQAVVSLIGVAVVRLPVATEARTLAERLGQPLWSAEGEQPPRVVGAHNATSAGVVLVPVKR